MMTLGDVAQATGGTLLRGEARLAVRGVSTDSRTLSPGQLFVALRGPRFDGHAFLEAAAKGGAVAALVAADAPPAPAGLALVAVADTLRALGDLAAWHRRRFEPSVVGVTGSSGKTTTKEMIAAILALRGPTLATRGNLNNLVGVPLTLFGLAPEHRFAVIEMGMNAPGEIARLAEIARPAVGVVTNVGMAHAAGVGGIEGVARAKAELLHALGPDDFAVVNLDDERLATLRPTLRARVVTFGRAPGADVRLVGQPEVALDGTTARVRVGSEAVEIRLPLLGAHQAYNALAAMAAARALGFTADEMSRGLASTAATPGRVSVRRAGRLTILDDTYNANPGSMAAALDTLAALSTGRRPVAVLGDMLELGEASPAEHRAVGRLAARRAAVVFAFGPEAAHIAAGAREAGLAEVFHATDLAEMESLLRSHVGGDDVVLLKGSRGMRLERLLAALGAQAEGH